MNPRMRSWLIGGAATLMALAAAVSIAGGKFSFAFLLIFTIALVIVEWAGHLRPETLLIGLLLAGYIVGNRGFAQIMPIDRVPLLLGELGIVAVGALVFIRTALNRTPLWRRDFLNGAVALWILAGTARIYWDVRLYGFMALRDFATIYYAIYFFLGQSIASDRAAPRWIGGILTAAFTLLPAITAVSTVWPEFFLQHLTFRGVPLIFQRGDLVAAFLFGGTLFLLAHKPVARWRWIAAGVTVFGGFELFSRSGMVAFAVATAIWVSARRRQILVVVITVLVLGLGLSGTAGFLRNRDFRQTRAYAFYERALSIFDPTGTRTYRNVNTQASGDNNRFRLVWWKTIAGEVWEKSPVIGLGFGYDLSEEFLRAYYGMAVDEDFNARSPHSIVFTMLGRLGLIGLFAFIVLVAAMSGRTWLTVRALKTARPKAESTLAYFSLAFLILVSACFGVVLEGPMGAVVFWIWLGFANGLAHEYVFAPDESEPPAVAETSPARLLPLQPHDYGRP